MAKTNTTNTNATANNNAQAENKKARKPKAFEQKMHSVKEFGKKAVSGPKKLGSLAIRSGREVAVDCASAGIGLAVGGLAAKGAHNAVTVGSQVICNEYNFATGKGTVSVKGKFGKWKEISTSEYLAAVNRGKVFKEAIPNYFTNRHADTINKVADGVGIVAGATGTVGGFAVSRNAMNSVLMTEKTKEEIAAKKAKKLMHSLDVDIQNDGETADI